MTDRIFGILTFFLFTMSYTYAQNINIPDPVFKDFLTQELCIDKNGDGRMDDDADTNDDGQIDVAEALLLKNLNIATFPINDLTGIEYFSNLESLLCTETELDSIYLTNLTKLSDLDCTQTGLKYLDLNGAPNLKRLYCYGNSLSKLELQYVPNLDELHCADNRFTKLDLHLCPDLRILTCDNNRLTTLDLSNFSKMEHVYAPNNFITSAKFENSPNFKEIYLNYNELTTLSFTDNPKLNTLFCGDNKLTSLELKDIEKITYLNFYNNLLTSINLKTVMLQNGGFFDYRENPNFRYICCDIASFESIRNRVEEFIEVNTYCSKDTNQNINKITGVVRYDIDKNNCDANDPAVSNYMLYAKDATQPDPPPYYFTTQQNGRYEIRKLNVSGNLNSNISNKIAFKSDPEFYPYNFTSSNEILERNFCISAIGDYNDMEVSIVPIESLIPGNNVQYKVLIHNKGNKVSNGEVYFDFDNTRMQFISSSQSPDAIVGGKVKWSYSNVLPFGTKEFDINLNCNSPAATPPVNIGDTLKFSTTIKSNLKNETSLDTNFVLIQLAQNSSSNNTVECLQGNTLPFKRIDEFLHYMIKFKNTNSSVTPNIFIQSQIDTNLFNLASLQVLSTSHAPQMQVLRGYVIEFALWDINLMPSDSGYILFKIKAKPKVTVGNVLKVSSRIYFESDKYTNLNDVDVLVDYPNFYDKIVFQDSNFRKALVSSICVDTNNDFNPDSDADFNNDGEIQVSEAIKVEKLFLRARNIKSLRGIEEFCLLNFLDCSENELDSLELRGLGMLKILESQRNKIKSIDLNGSPLLENLNLINNSLTTLDLKNTPKLKYLYCYNNLMDSLNLRFSPDLIIAYCSHNQLSKLEVGNLKNLTTLNVQRNKLQSIELQDLPQLDTMNISANQLDNLNLSSLKKLKSLDCSENKLTSLDIRELKELIHLNIGNNQITSIDLNEQANLLNFYCNINPLSALEISKLIKLKILHCSITNIEFLNIENSKDLIDLNCYATKLNALFLKNGAKNLPTLRLDQNSFLKYICCEDNHIDQVNSILVSLGKTDCNVNSYCSFNGGGKVYTVSGDTKYSINGIDCNANDPAVPFVKYKVSNASQSGEFTFSKTGNYRLFLTEGEHTIKPQIELSNYYSITPDTLTVKFPGISDSIAADFCFKPIGVKPDAKIIIIPKDPLRPGFPIEFSLVYSNVGNAMLNGDILFEYDEKLIKFIKASTPPDMQSTNTLLWHFSNLPPFESRTISFKLICNSPMDDPPVNNDDILKFVARINVNEIDDNLANNIFELNSIAVGSLDPNDLTCLEGDYIRLEQVGKSLHYLCRFENVGTFNAQNVVIKHELDPQIFDVNTVEILDVSHKSWSRMKNSNILEFIFENINLPFDTLNNKGYVLYKINTRADLQHRDTIRNAANIYFDFNFPIMTNVAKTVVGFPTSTKNIDNYTASELFPNPTNDILYLPYHEGLLKYEIFDINGKVVKSQTLSNNDPIDLSELKLGTYIIKMNIGNRTVINKFIKM